MISAVAQRKGDHFLWSAAEYFDFLGCDDTHKSEYSVSYFSVHFYGMCEFLEYSSVQAVWVTQQIFYLFKGSLEKFAVDVWRHQEKERSLLPLKL